MPLKRLSVIQLAFSYAGSFIGAGFISGQEIWAFFGCFGTAGFAGFAVVSVLCLFLNYAAIDTIRSTGSEEMGRLLTVGENRSLILAVDVLQWLFLFGITVIMTAGASALFKDMTGLPAAAAGGVFTVLVLIAALCGLQSLVTVFSLLVPAAAVCTAVIGFIVLRRAGFQLAPAAGSGSALLPNWQVSCITYTAYNLFGNLSVIVPLARYIPDRKTMRRGLPLGALFLMLLAYSMIAAFLACPEAGLDELPMSFLARTVHPAVGTICGIMMGTGMFGSALGCVLALYAQLSIRSDRVRDRRVLFFVLAGAVSFLFSLAGFSTLVGMVYPVFGYLSIPLFVTLAVKWVRGKAGSRG